MVEFSILPSPNAHSRDTTRGIELLTAELGSAINSGRAGYARVVSVSVSSSLTVWGPTEVGPPFFMSVQRCLVLRGPSSPVCRTLQEDHDQHLTQNRVETGYGGGAGSGGAIRIVGGSVSVGQVTRTAGQVGGAIVGLEG